MGGSSDSLITEDDSLDEEELDKDDRLRTMKKANAEILH